MQEVRIRCIQEGKNPAEIAKEIDAAYPFGERAMWPYKAWLSARKEFFARHGLPRRVPKSTNQDMFADEVKP